jgi:hypothetical protein
MLAEFALVLVALLVPSDSNICNISEQLALD